MFQDIAKKWGDIKEIEDLTASKDQICIGRVCVASQAQNFIFECIKLIIDGRHLVCVSLGRS